LHLALKQNTVNKQFDLLENNMYFWT